VYIIARRRNNFGKNPYNVNKEIKERDFELIRDAKAGSVKAYDELINKYRAAVYNLVFRMVRNQHEAEDLMQEAFIKVYNSLNSFNEEYAFSTWLFKIATNNCIDYFRKRKLQTLSLDKPIKYKDSEMQHEYADPELDAEKTLIAKERSKLIQEAINALPKKYYVAIDLRHREEKSYEEIAEILKLPLGTVKARIFRAREMLNKTLKDILH
jgi:RNA polymerase sigma factor (sigma-70 family)